MIGLLGQLVRAQRDRLAFVSVGLIQRILPFLLLPVFVRFMTPAEYGHVAILTAAFTLASMVFGLGQEVVEYRYHFDDSAPGRSLESAAVRVHLVGPVVLALPVAGLLLLSGATPAGVPTLAVSGSVLAGALHATAWRFPAVHFRCQGELARYALAGAGFAGVSSAIKVGLVVGLGWGAVAWPVGDLLGALLLLAGTASLLLKVARRAPVTRSDVRSTLGLGLPATVGHSARWVSGYADRVLVVALASAVVGGSYFAASQLVMIGGVLLIELSAFLQPVIAREQDLAAAARGVLPGHARACSAVAVLTAAGSAVLVELGFVGDYTEVLPIALVLCASLPLVGLSYLGGDICSVRLGDTRFLAVVSVVTALAAIGANLLLIPFAGAYGAALSLLLSQGLAVAMLWWRVSRATGGARALLPHLLWPTALGIALAGLGLAVGSA
ncbi:lipopolysaccharide biosynthesis protein [Nocardioides taihuensis]|uniref:Lipopolysaccharide biosynthesis protein n=1 Tax=Nocardioides taihuensis TaxID=1835606 RepID=A0ABW0BFE9_9ACTN